MTITIRVDEDEAVPCSCKFRQWVGHDLVIVPTAKGKLLYDALRRARVPVRLGVTDGSQDEPPR